MNFYEVLQLPTDCTAKDITKNFRQLALKNHPDRGGNTQQFQKINEAYEVLSDPQKRADYDHKLKYQSASPNHGGNSPFGNTPFGGGFNQMFSNMFQQPINLNNLFRSMNIRFNRTPKRLPDEHKTIDITFAEAMHDITKFQLKHIESLCQKCCSKCPSCEGQGFVMQPMNHNMMIQTVQQMRCNNCNQTGIAFHKQSFCICAEGKLQNQVVKIQFDMKKHDILNLQKKYESLGTQPMNFIDIEGDLYLKCKLILPDKCLLQSNGDIIYQPELNSIDMLCGTTLHLPTDLLYDQPIVIPPLSLKASYKYTIENQGIYINENNQRSKIIIEPIINYDDTKMVSEVQIHQLKCIFQRNQQNKNIMQNDTLNDSNIQQETINE
jgi:DnaJ-class molecular chaperone